MKTPIPGTLRFDDRVVVVTGAGRGMGRAHALLLADRGAKVVVNDLGTMSMEGGDSQSEVAESVAQEIRAAGGEAVASPHSVATPEGAQSIIDTAVDAWGRIDAVVHNAGIAKFTALAELSYDEYRRTLAVHIDGALLLTTAAWPHMVRQNYGRFLYISSAAGLLGVPSQGAYAVAKTGMLGLMNVAKLEGAEHNIRANTLGVAAYTRMTATMFQGGDAEGHEDTESWWKRYMRPESVSPVVAWLIHEQCAANGEIYDTFGGSTTRLFVGATPGYVNLDLTPEALRDHMDDLRDEAGYQIFAAGWESAEYHSGRIMKAIVESPLLTMPSGEMESTR